MQKAILNWTVVTLIILIGGCVLGNAFPKISTKNCYSIIFPVAPLKMSRVEKISKFKLTYVVPYISADHEVQRKQRVISITATKIAPDDLIAVFIVEGYFPIQKKLNVIYVSPKLELKELEALIHAGNRSFLY